MLLRKLMPAIVLAGAVTFGASTSVYAQQHWRDAHRQWRDYHNQQTTECRGHRGRHRGHCVRESARERRDGWKRIRERYENEQDQGTDQEDQAQQTDQSGQDQQTSQSGSTTQDLYQSCMAQYNNDATFCTSYVNASQVY